MRITGTWKGHYVYGADYGDEEGFCVPFRMSLAESSGGRVAGYVRDDAARGGAPETGRIVGRMDGSRLEFVKSMPETYMADGEELRDLATWLADEVGHELPDRLPRHRIRYTGRLSGGSTVVEGEWELLPRILEVAGGRYAIGGSGTGAWSARRVSDQLSAV